MKRYSLEDFGYGPIEMESSPDGDYILYDDHVREMIDRDVETVHRNRRILELMEEIHKLKGHVPL